MSETTLGKLRSGDKVLLVDPPGTGTIISVAPSAVVMFANGKGINVEWRRDDDGSGGMYVGIEHEIATLAGGNE